LTLQATSTQKQYKAGDIREDGYIFKCYDSKLNTAGSRITYESWLSPETYQKYKIRVALGGAKRRAKDASVPFDLNYAYLEEIFPKDNKCPIFGIEMEWGRENGQNNSPSLDRIHPALGYVKGNVIWISMYANRLKQDHSLDTLRTLLAFYENLERRKE
jgi:hypothetical protein